MKKLTISLTNEEFTTFQKDAKAAGLSMSEWAYKQLTQGPRPLPAVFDEAFRRIDEADARREFSNEPPPPEVPKVPSAKVEMLGKPVPSTHACAFHVELLRTDGGPPKVCAHSGQLGRPCYFPSSRAPDCMVFAPKR